VRAFVEASKAVAGALGVVLALFLLTVIVKIITAPLTTMAFRGMRDMQRIQPLLKELQEKYKDDREKLALEMQRVYKENNVSMTGGCLPMLIQLPIFWIVYHAVQVYAYGFSATHFLWVKNLAMPDIPLLILYAISMIVTQKLTAAPAADPQQQVMQNQMTYMMPIFLVFVLVNFASAFVLYWFFLNVLSSAHQYYLMRKFKQEEATKAGTQIAAASAPPARKKGKK
jgi:YidC/Oxa1 family membrane protein insertase